MKNRDLVIFCLVSFALGIVFALMGVQTIHQSADKGRRHQASGVAVGMYDVDGLLLWSVKAPPVEEGIPNTVFDLTNMPTRGRYMAIYADLPPVLERQITK